MTAFFQRRKGRQDELQQITDWHWQNRLKSDDFGGNDDHKNLFAHPLGPKGL